MLENVVVGRERGLAERLGDAEVLERDLPDQLQVPHQPHLVVLAGVELRRNRRFSFLTSFWELHREITINMTIVTLTLQTVYRT